MNVATIKYQSVGNFDGISTSLYVSGCSHACRGCFNKETWNRNYGYLYTEEVENEILKSLDNPYVKTLVLLGGEPLMSYNIDPLIGLCQRVKNELSFPKRIVLFSGFTFEEIVKNEHRLKLLKEVDVLIDGRFEEDKHSLKLKWRGSSNQRVLHVPASLKEMKAIPYYSEEC